MYKQVHEKKGIRESQHRDVTNLCEVGVFSRKILQLLKIRPPPSLKSPWTYFALLYYKRWKAGQGLGTRLQNREEIDFLPNGLQWNQTPLGTN